MRQEVGQGGRIHRYGHHSHRGRDKGIPSTQKASDSFTLRKSSVRSMFVYYVILSNYILNIIKKSFQGFIHHMHCFVFIMIFLRGK